MAAEKRTRREMVQLAGAGVLGLGALQSGSMPRKQVFNDVVLLMGEADGVEMAAEVGPQLRGLSSPLL